MPYCEKHFRLWLEDPDENITRCELCALEDGGRLNLSVNPLAVVMQVKGRKLRPSTATYKSMCQGEFGPDALGCVKANAALERLCLDQMPKNPKKGSKTAIAVEDRLQRLLTDRASLSAIAPQLNARLWSVKRSLLDQAVLGAIKASEEDGTAFGEEAKGLGGMALEGFITTVIETMAQ